MLFHAHFLSIVSSSSSFRLTRACASISAESPLLRGQSSLSASDELEYDYYDGTTIPGSLLAPPTQLLTAYGDMTTEIDIDQARNLEKWKIKII